MCIAREHFNLCKCGCPEIIHEEDFISGMIAEASGFMSQGRGKCNGERLSVSSDPSAPRFLPCDCQKFDPIFKPMCTGFGG